MQCVLVSVQSTVDFVASLNFLKIFLFEVGGRQRKRWEEMDLLSAVALADSYSCWARMKPGAWNSHFGPPLGGRAQHCCLPQ